jgi:prophage DNA circulation protein
MSWQDKMGPATFRGVSFFVETAERSGGRRTVKHEYPGRDLPFSEDLGRKARSFPVEGYVIGADYMDARDALLDVLEQAGSGELVHPYHGTRRVVVASYRVRETADRGGMAMFSIEFDETPAKPAQPTAVPDAASKVASSVGAARAAVGTEFLSTYNVASQPQWTMDALAGVVSSATAKVGALVAPLVSDAQSAAALKLQLDGTILDAETLVTVPADVLGGVLGLFESLTDFQLGRAGLSAILKAYGFDPGERPPSTTTTRATQQKNFDALQSLVQRLAVVQAAELAPSQSYDSYDDAITTRDAITALLDEQAESAGDDAYPALNQLRADLVKAIPGSSGDLPRLVQYTPPVTIASIVLTYQLYGSLDLESDILSRNHVRNPFFVLGRRVLEVLSRE